MRFTREVKRHNYISKKFKRQRTSASRGGCWNP